MTDQPNERRSTVHLSARSTRSRSVPESIFVPSSDDASRRMHGRCAGASTTRVREASTKFAISLFDSGAEKLFDLNGDYVTFKTALNALCSDCWMRTLRMWSGFRGEERIAVESWHRDIDCTLRMRRDTWLPVESFHCSVRLLRWNRLFRLWHSGGQEPK